MRYKISTVWTPDATDCDRSRKALCFNHDGDLRSAGAAGLKAMGFEAEIIDAAMSDFDSGQSDSMVAAWTHHSNNGDYEITVERWESGDPVTPERLREWATERANDEGATPEEALAGVLGRYYWWYLEGDSERDLREALHELYMDGQTNKGCNQMTLDELVSSLLEDIIAPLQHNYQEKTEPWGFAVMIKDDKRLWLGEGF